jgi:hypothetical protein
MYDLNNDRIPIDLENFLQINLPNVGKSKSKMFILAV